MLLRTIKDGGEFVKGFSAAGGIKKDPGAPGVIRKRGDWADGAWEDPDADPTPGSAADWPSAHLYSNDSNDRRGRWV